MDFDTAFGCIRIGTEYARSMPEKLGIAVEIGAGVKTWRRYLGRGPI